jgi:hypothetical protein
MTAIEVFQSMSAEKHTAKEARRIITKDKIEEAVGIVFITLSFFVTGWFYYNLYQALHDYVAF